MIEHWHWFKQQTLPRQTDRQTETNSDRQTQTDRQIQTDRHREAPTYLDTTVIEH